MFLTAAFVAADSGGKNFRGCGGGGGALTGAAPRRRKSKFAAALLRQKERTFFFVPVLHSFFQVGPFHVVVVVVAVF